MNQRDYENIECYTDTPTRGMTSARRWRNTASDVVNDMDSPAMSYVEVEPQIHRASRPPRTEQHMIESQYYPRPRTDEDRSISRDVRRMKPAPVRAPQQPVKRWSRRKILTAAGFGLLGLVVFYEGLTALGSFVDSEWNQFNNEVAEGQYPSTSIKLVCGHNDSQQYPTELRAFVRSDYRIQLDELNTKNPGTIHYFVSEKIPFSGPLNQVNLKLTPQQLATGKYQILLTIKMGGVGVRQPVTESYLLFADSGKGYFVGIQNAQ